MIEQTLPKEMLEMASVQEENEDKWLGMQNVVGVALGNRIKNETKTEEPVISVLVNQKMAPDLLSDKDRVDKIKLKNYATDVVEVGDIFAGGGLSAVEDKEIQEVDGVDKAVEIQTHSSRLARRIRPAMGGFSVGHYRITAGTIGTCCYDLSPFPGIPPRIIY